VRSVSVIPRNERAPCSVTTQSTSLRDVLTGPLRRVTIRCAGSATIAVPPAAAAARRKSTWPPTGSEHAPPRRLGAYLAVQIDLDGAVDRAQPPTFASVAGACV